MSYYFDSIVKAFHNPELIGSIRQQESISLSQWIDEQGYAVIRYLAKQSDVHIDARQMADFVSNHVHNLLSISRKPEHLKKLLGESRKYSGDNFVNRWLPIIFHRVLAKDRVWLDVLNGEPDGSLLMDILGCDEDGSLSICKLRQQADEFPCAAFQMLFKVNTVLNPYLNTHYNFLIMSFCVISLQRMLEDGYASDDLFAVFCRRNSSLLRALGAHTVFAEHMGRFLACKAFFAYPREQWAKGISPLEMLGPETLDLDSMINFREDHSWMVSPVADARWNTQSLCDFIQELTSVEMDSRRLFTSGMDYLIENSDEALVKTCAGYATQLLSLIHI